MITMLMYPIRLRVHIAPVGYEQERIYKPLIGMKADRVWLLVYNKDNKAQVYQQKVEETLDRAHITHKTATCDITDLYDVLRALREIINKEEGNDIYINVSSGTKIEAIAGMMMSMIMSDTIVIQSYYVVPKKYNNEPKNGEPLSTGTREVFQLPRYPINRPGTHLIDLLKILDSHKGRMSKRELIEEAERLSLIKAGLKNPKQSLYISLTKKYLEPLESWKSIKIIKEGRSRKILPTEEGKNMLKFLG